MKLSSVLAALLLVVLLFSVLVAAGSQDDTDTQEPEAGGMNMTDECANLPIVIFIWPDGTEEPVWNEQNPPMGPEGEGEDSEENIYTGPSAYWRPYVSPYYRYSPYRYTAPYWRAPYYYHRYTSPYSPYNRYTSPNYSSYNRYTGPTR